MVAPLVAAAGITGLAGLIGGAADRSAGRRQTAEDRAYQAKREDSRFQRASTDAKAAGLHPLFALGAAGAGSPQFIAGQAETGSALGDAVRGVGRVAAAHQKSKITANPLAQRLAELQIENAEVTLEHSKLDLTQRQNILSGNQVITQAAGASQDIPGVVQGGEMEKYSGLVEPTPTKIVTTKKGSTSKTAGIKPGWDEVSIIDGLPPILIPQSEEGWGEDLTIMKFAVIAAANAPSMAKFLVMLNVKTVHEGLELVRKATKRIRGRKSAVTTPEFRKRVDSTKSTRKRIY